MFLSINKIFKLVLVLKLYGINILLCVKIIFIDDYFKYILVNNKKWGCIVFCNFFKGKDDVIGNYLIFII